MTGNAHDTIAPTDVGLGASVAPEGHPLRRLLDTFTRLWLARALPYEPAALGTLVLLDHLSGLLVLVGTEALRG
ncbi:MAG: hypothetical protein ACOYOJ_22445 [Alsobacter sp.]